ncbi:MAG: hypothetical protein AB1405_17775, partial [Bdellovibrionota bacterium]
MPKARRERVLLLETQLDQELASERSQVPYMRELFRNFAGVELLAREAHSRADLKKFLEVARRDRQIRAVHLVAHGLKKRKKTSIVLTRDESVDLSQ